MSMIQERPISEQEMTMKNSLPDYAMFSDAGNAAVHGIVLTARITGASWAKTLDALRVLAELDEYGEAMDTAVREVVYHALAFDQRDENFYI